MKKKTGKHECDLCGETKRDAVPLFHGGCQVCEKELYECVRCLDEQTTPLQTCRACVLLLARPCDQCRCSGSPLKRTTECSHWICPGCLPRPDQLWRSGQPLWCLPCYARFQEENSFFFPDDFVGEDLVVPDSKRFWDDENENPDRRGNVKK